MLSASSAENFDVIGRSNVARRYKYKVSGIVLNRIKADKLRTGVGSRALLHGLGHMCPQGLSADMIDRWISGRTEKANWEHVDWVLKRYASLPTKLKIQGTRIAQ
ncbi:MAG: hypothetical protein ABJP58_13085 [Parasphingorhabdus sp.]|uniref:hypothetical protein n=1 Tax=Parasphingorhabdus sp. TaxID=2709688 RepID=UPI003266AEB5